jgi:PAS domain S-box-containing protein
MFTSWLLYFLIRTSEAGMKKREDDLSRLNRSLKAYSECHQALIRADDEMQLMHNICKTIVEVGEYRVAWVGSAEYDVERTILPVAQWGDTGGYLKNLKASWSNTDMGRGPTGIALKTGQPVVVQHIEYDPKWERWREEARRHGFQSSISLPLISNGRPFAALVIFSGDTSAFDDEEVKLLSELADDLSYGIVTLRAAIENKKVEKERKLLASVIEQAKEGIFLIDGNGTIQYVNHAIKTITGLAPNAMIGQNIHSIDCGDSNRMFYASILNGISSGKENIGHFQYKRSDDVIFELNVISWAVIDGDNNVISHVALVCDVTLEMQLERHVRNGQRMEAIGTLAGGIAHDFNNTLSSIITCSEMAMDEAPKGSTLEELLDVILKSGLRGKNLVKQILTFSRQGEQERQEVRVDLIVGECLKLLRSSLPASIEIRLNLGKEPGLVFADPTQIHQIAMNLCTNAVHAMRGKPRGILDISLDNVELDSYIINNFGNLPPGGYIRLKIKDNGHGMDQITLDRIFDPFFSTKDLGEGTGLGLSVIHGIVTKNGGSIKVKSDPGKGATFTVYLPRIEATNRSDLQEERPALLPGGNESILLVDDEENLIFAAQRMLKNLGYTVVAMTDPRKALQLFRSQSDNFDLVITDQNMPHINGIKLAQEITRIRSTIPIILCTGFDPLSSGAMSSEGETAEYISELALKPLERGEIASLIRKVLDDPSSRGEL